MEILFEDKDIIVTVKKAGILSQRGESRGENLEEILSEYLKDKGEEGEIHVIHRLDKGVGGIMVYAKNSFSASKLSSQLQRGEIIKEYTALIHSKPEPPEGFMEDLLFFDRAKNKSFVVSRERKGVKKAKLYYETVRTEKTVLGEVSLVRIRLYTGRTHQIRVQFSSRNMPLVGDKRYGGHDECDIALFSCFLSFRHPATNEIMTFEKNCDFCDLLKQN